ncbi:UNVERIFIED_ORG: phage repressor protein C with HTH and peptisase S24 domain [Martelella mediterranea]
MDKIRRLIAKRIQERGLTYKQVSLALGKNHAYMQQYVERGVPTTLKERTRSQLAELLDIPEEDIGGPQHGKPAPVPEGDVPNLTIHSGAGNGGLLHIAVDENGNVRDPANTDGFWSFPQSVKNLWRSMGNTYAFPVIGDSMHPTITSGSYVFIDTGHKNPAPEDIYAINYGDGLMVKRIALVPRSDKVRVISDNDRYPDYELLRTDLEVYGRVIAVFQWRG